MIKVNRILPSGVLVAFALVALPAAGEAAWWKPFSRDNGQAAQQAPAAGGGQVQLAQGGADASERFNRIEDQMRTLTGQVEQLTYQLRQLQEQLTRAQQDTEYRLNELEGGKGAPPQRAAQAPAAAQEAPLSQEAAAPVVEPGQDTIGAIAAAEAPMDAPMDSGGEAPLGTPPRPLGTLSVDESGQPLDISPGSGAPEAAPLPQPTAPAAGGGQTVMASLGDPRADYDRAYNYILSGDYDLAESSFRQFTGTYPTDRLAADAQYWLGESLFARGKYREAATEFLNGYNANPKSGKAPDTLFKLGLSLAGLGERDTACRTYSQVLKQYPKISNALKQRVVTEQASASC